MSVTPTPVTAALAGIFSGLTWPLIWPLVTGTEASATLWLVLATIVLVALPAHAFVLGFQRQRDTGRAQPRRRAADSHRHVARGRRADRAARRRVSRLAVTVKRLRHRRRRRRLAGRKGAFSAREALAFVREHGVVLVSAKGRGPNLVEAIAGEPVKGSWWGHPEGKRIFSVLNAVTESDEVLVCRLIDGKITLVHRRLWPALVRLAEAFPPERIAQVLDGHTASGRHVSRSLAFRGLGAARGRAGGRGARRGRSPRPPRRVAAAGATGASRASDASGDDTVAAAAARCRRLHSCGRPDGGGTLLAFPDPIRGAS